jgi:5-methylcytosine-specific restriction endonuclease McrA
MIAVPYSDPDRRRAYGRDWMKRNKQRARDAMRRWRSRHRERDRANKRDYYARNTDRSKAAVATYRRLNPEILRVVRTLRRAREMKAEGHYTLAEWLALLAEYRHRCGYCGVTGKLEPDHRIPLARGGSNWISNIIPACRTCNTRKRTATESEFRARLAGASVSATVAGAQHHEVEEGPDEQNGKQT